MRAFEHLGGVVLRCIYDNLKAAVKRRLGDRAGIALRAQGRGEGVPVAVMMA